VIVGDEIVKIFFEIGAGATDGVDLVAANHFGERQADLGGAHGAGKSEEHFSAAREELGVGFGGVNDDGSVEMAIVMLDEGTDRTRDLQTHKISFPKSDGENTRGDGHRCERKIKVRNNLRCS
jgi:hypothetical protein